MAINITQFAPPATVSNLVWDDDMTAAAGKNFVGDLTGNVTGNITGYSTKTWNISVGAGQNLLPSTASYACMQVYQLSPSEKMTGIIRCSVGNAAGSPKLVFLHANMSVLGTSILTTTATDYTLPAGTNGIYFICGTVATYLSISTLVLS